MTQPQYKKLKQGNEICYKKNIGRRHSITESWTTFRLKELEDSGKSHKQVSGFGAVVKVVDSQPYGWGSIPGKSCSFLIVSLSKSLSLCVMCSDQHVKYRIPRGFPLTSSLLLDYHVKQHTHTPAHTQEKEKKHSTLLSVWWTFEIRYQYTTRREPVPWLL